MIPRTLGIAALRAAYATGVLEPVELARAIIARADAAADPAVWITRVPDAALLARADALAADPAARALPLFGIPFAVKDNIDVAGMATSAGCPAFARVADADAPVVARLLAAGAMLVGKTNLDQFATGLVGTRSPHGAPRSVFSTSHVSGGSSSGSAVAVASGLASFSLGTDTAGSGRVPAAFNGIVGLKPTRGLLSSLGVVPACASLDCVSVFALDTADAWLAASVAAGAEEGDAWSRAGAAVALPAGPLRVGVLADADRDFDHPDFARLYDAAIERAAALGHRIVPFDYAPFRETGALLYGGAFVAERTAAVGDFIAAHPDAVDPTVRRIIEGGRAASAVDLFRDQHRLMGFAKRSALAWGEIDVMLLPTAPGHPTVEAVAADPIGANGRLGLYTNFVNMLDLAAIAVPAGQCGDGLGFGVTLVGPAFSDAALAVLAGTMSDRITVVVAGAHLSGMALNHELLALGGVLRGAARTAPGYELHALAGTVPAKPGLVRGVGDASIEVEEWALPVEGFGRFVASIPAPLGIGKVTLQDGRELPGFICEPGALAGARNITAFGGWRRWMAEGAASARGPAAVDGER
jgi:allophanate hydrolase